MATMTEWTILEKLLLAQAVYKYGADDWFQITRTLKNHPMMRQPSEFYNQKNCSLQYYILIESLEAEKRQPKLGGPPTQDMPDVVRIANQLYTQRMEELRRLIKEDEDKFVSLLGEIDEIRAGKWDAKLAKEAENNPQFSRKDPAARIIEPDTADTITKIPKIATDGVEREDADLKRKPESIMTRPTPVESRASPIEEEPDVATKRPRLDETTAKVDHMQIDQKTIPAQPVPVLPSAESQADQPRSDEQQRKEEESSKDKEELQPQLGEQQHHLPELQERPEQQLSGSNRQIQLEGDEARPSKQEQVKSFNEKQQAMEPSLSVEERPQSLEKEYLKENSQERNQPSTLDYTEGSEKPVQHLLEQRLQGPAEAMDTSDVDDGRERLTKPTEPSETKAVPPTSDMIWQESTSNVNIPIIEGKKEQDYLPQILGNNEVFGDKHEYEAESPAAVTTQGTNSPATTTGHDRDGTESITGSESNAATPTHSSERKRTKDDQRQKSWQKNINLLWREIANHKNGAMYMNPIKEATAPLYYDIVKHPIDLKTIKNRIRDGVIKTTTEFERDITLMLTNSLMYNREGTEIYQMAVEMLDDVTEQLRVFKTADANSSSSTHTRSATTTGG